MFAFADERAVFAPLSDLQVASYRVLLDFPVPKLVKISNDPCICDSGKTRAKCCFKVSISLLERHVHLAVQAPRGGGTLHIFWVQGVPSRRVAIFQILLYGTVLIFTILV